MPWLEEINPMFLDANKLSCQFWLDNTPITLKGIGYMTLEQVDARAMACERGRGGEIFLLAATGVTQTKSSTYKDKKTLIEALLKEF